MSRGRRAALPPAGFRPQQRLRSDDNRLVVRFVPEDGKSVAKDYDFTVFPVTCQLQTAFAQAFVARTKPGAGLRSTSSTDGAFGILASFAHYLGSLVRPPDHAGELTAAQVNTWLLQRSHLAGSAQELGGLKLLLKRAPGISPEFAAAMNQSHKRPKAQPTTSIYSRDEFRRILAAARFDVRRAAERIRAARTLLAQWRSGAIDSEQDQRRWRRGHLLDYVDHHTDVPRYSSSISRQPMKWVHTLGTVVEHITSLHLSTDDAAAFAVLLTGLTGENPSTITDAPAAHHRPDGYAGPIASAIVELDKPRRKSRRHMDVALVGLPDWIAPPSEGEILPQGEDDADDLHSAFGVYMLLHDLAAPARRLAGTDRLFAWWAPNGGRGCGAGFRTEMDSDRIKDWADGRDLPMEKSAGSQPQSQSGDDEVAEDTTPPQLRVTLAHLRRTHLELHQRPVAHTQRTLANDYLVRQRGNITEYQQVVADTLEKEARKARTRTALRTLSAAEVEQARTDPKAVAARHGMDPATLRRMLGGGLDTVMVACGDNNNGPHSPSGTPCRASFMLCLSCPNARSLPHHLPLQVAVHDAVQARQEEMTPLRWAQRFTLSHTQLGDLLDRAGQTAVADARNGITPDQRELVERFLNRELDLS